MKRLKIVATGLVMFLGAACYPDTQVNTEFPQRLAACRTLGECQAVEQGARRDMGGCSSKTTIYVLADGPKKLPCDVAQKNLNDAEDKVARLRGAEQDQQRAEQNARRKQMEDEQAERMREQRARVEEQNQQRRDMERQRLADQVAQLTTVVQTCDATKDARAARKKHMEMMQSQEAASIVQKRCAPRRGTNAVQSQCTDANGFVRTCTKQVAGDVVGYTCPKSVDADIAKIGLFQLQMSDYPFPDDQRINVRDGDCEVAPGRLKVMQDRLSPPSPAASAATDAGNAADLSSP